MKAARALVKTSLSPQEYHYLYSPMRADPLEMVKYSLKGLCASGELEIFSKPVYINPSAKYKRVRAFLRRGANYNAQQKYSNSDKFLLSLFEDENELRLYAIRQKLNLKLDEKPERFRTDYVYKDVHENGYCRFKYFLTHKGRVEKLNCANLIDSTDSEINLLLKNESKLTERLDQLGRNIIFLEEVTLKKIKKLLPGLDELDLLFGLDIDEIPGGFSSGGFGGFGGGSYGGGGGGFGGFGGGSFGGGGAGGSW